MYLSGMGRPEPWQVSLLRQAASRMTDHLHKAVSGVLHFVGLSLGRRNISGRVDISIPLGQIFLLPLLSMTLL